MHVKDASPNQPRVAYRRRNERRTDRLPGKDLRRTMVTIIGPDCTRGITREGTHVYPLLRVTLFRFFCHPSGVHPLF